MLCEVVDILLIAYFPVDNMRYLPENAVIRSNMLGVELERINNKISTTS
jgi:hypothetical protein